MLTGFDYAVSVILGLSALRGLWRGLLAEVFALIGWVAALIIAGRYMSSVAPYIPADWPGGALTQFVCAFAAIALTVKLAAGVLGALLGRLISVSGLRALDSSLGMVFGVMRGMILIIVLAALAGLTDLPGQAFWRNALLRPYVEQGVSELKAQLPSALVHYLH